MTLICVRGSGLVRRRLALDYAVASKLALSVNLAVYSMPGSLLFATAAQLNKQACSVAHNCDGSLGLVSPTVCYLCVPGLHCIV